MAIPISFFIFPLFILLLLPPYIAATNQSCRPTCGSLPVKYPFGTGYGCGSPRFQPYITCATDSDVLHLTTHTGSYPITSISYDTSTFTITPPSMSTCNSMQTSPNLGLDWASPFQIGPSTILLLSCTPPTAADSAAATPGSPTPICDPSSSDLCESFYTCPSVIGIGLPLFPPTNTCCVYSPANFNGKGELDLHLLKCEGYTSIVSLRDYPTDPNRWEYGVSLKYTNGAFDNYSLENECNACEESGGVCGYSPASHSFVCVCENGFNTTTQCSNFSSIDLDDEGIVGSSVSLSIWKSWLWILGGLIFSM